MIAAVVRDAFVQTTPAAFEVLQVPSVLLGQRSRDFSVPTHLMPLMEKGAAIDPKKELVVKESALRYPSCLQTTVACVRNHIKKKLR